MLSKSADAILSDIGFLGQIEVDLSVGIVRADGQISDLMGIDRDRLLSGVDLRTCDRSVIPEDLEMMRRQRNSGVATPGRYQTCFGFKNPHGEGKVAVQSIMDIDANRFGIATRAKGILIENPVRMLAADNDEISAETLLRILQLSMHCSRKLGFGLVSQMLGVVCKMVADRS